MLFLFAQRDLLNISEVITDMLWLIALALHALKISNLHSLHSWRNIVGELSDSVDRLLPEGLRVTCVSVVHGFKTLRILQKEVRNHGRCGMLR